MSEENSFKASELLKVFFSNIDESKLQEANAVLNGWKNAVVTACKDGNNTGQKLADHSRVLDLKNGILQIETDHPGWIQLFFLYQKDILRELKKLFPDLDIKGLSFKLT